MGTVDLPKSRQAFSPHKPAPAAYTAVLRDVPTDEELRQAVTRIVEEETGNIIRYFGGKLSGGFFERLNIKGSINRHYEEIFNRYLTSDDHDDSAGFSCRSAGEIAELLRSMGGAGNFNTGEIEKAAGNKGNINELKAHANNILRRETDTGALCRRGAAGSIVKCIFRDNRLRPRTVTDVKLAVNIPDSGLIDPVFYHYAASRYLIKELISRHIVESIEREIDGSHDQKLEERLTKLLAENARIGYNIANICENIRKSADIENIRSGGFNMAVNSIVAILDNASMSFQFIESVKNGNELVIREYEDADDACLPDERYQIRLKYFDKERLAEECKEYDVQIKNFENRVRHLWDLIEVIYQDSKNVFKVNDFEDLAKKNKSRIRDLVRKKTGEAMYEITGEPAFEKGRIRAQLARMHERIKNMYEFLYPIERRVMEDRLDGLEKEYSRLDFIINPNHLQPGLLIDVDITSIKRKKTTLDSIAAAIDELLYSIFRGFQDAAFATFRLSLNETQGRTEKRKK